ncbi:MBL fold metallo-hydrolase [Pelagicoccus sp. SDUM812003]|uniref:MBL fold metallo-hydrolase n=1 Tax=Pelagicoccus sp. SDUM812003 TaxID=3041267 RepID=UPI00280F520F|nr:MBL fold metallo-hydrolase [Pelagicoccus sp. SDUM812003]MDQ8205442.1 MBL fold metallo-hydrolase [Pelagicoccus sp. SDUM812003]
MKLRFLGTGTSQGIPLIGCDCSVCRSDNPKNRRYRTHAHLEMGGLNIQIDAAPEFRLRALEHRIPKIDVVLLTHGHADHILGFDDMRRYCDLRKGEAIPVFTNDDGLERMRSIYPYAMRERPAVRGYPAFSVRPMPETLELEGGVGLVRSTSQDHGPFDTLGLVFEEFKSGSKIAYYTDCASVSEEAEELARGADLVVLDGLRMNEHPSHMSIDMAVDAARRIGAKRSFLIHMGHDVDHDRVNASLPEGVELSYDNLVVEV